MSRSIQPQQVAITLVNWHGWRDTLACIESLVAMRGGRRVHVVVADNASTDDSVQRILDWMAHRGPSAQRAIADLPAAVAYRVRQVVSVQASDCVQVTLVAKLANDGFAAGNNVAMAIAAAAGAPDYFWVLNNDTVVDTDALEHLLVRMESDPKVGMCGATVVFQDRPEVVQVLAGVHYSYLSGRGWLLGAGSARGVASNQGGIEQALTFIYGASMLVSRAFYDTVGPMEERYFLYTEELDWAWRARGRFSLAWAPEAVVFHKEGASIGTASARRPASLLSEFYQSRNKLVFTARYLPWFLPTVWAFTAARALRMALRGQRANARVVLSVMFGRQEPAAAWTTRRG